MQQSALGGVSPAPVNRSLSRSAPGPLHDVEVILPVDGHAADRADGPVLGQRLRKRGVVLEDRHLDALRSRRDDEPRPITPR